MERNIRCEPPAQVEENVGAAATELLKDLFGQNKHALEVTA